MHLIWPCTKCPIDSRFSHIYRSTINDLHHKVSLFHVLFFLGSFYGNFFVDGVEFRNFKQKHFFLVLSTIHTYECAQWHILHIRSATMTIRIGTFSFNAYQPKSLIFGLWLFAYVNCNVKCFFWKCVENEVLMNSRASCKTFPWIQRNSSSLHNDCCWLHSTNTVVRHFLNRYLHNCMHELKGQKPVWWVCTVHMGSNITHRIHWNDDVRNGKHQIKFRRHLTL